jgi:hypothetical protein
LLGFGNKVEFFFPRQQNGRNRNNEQKDGKWNTDPFMNPSVNAGISCSFGNSVHSSEIPRQFILI